MLERTRRAEVLEHQVLYRDVHAYCAHPHLAVTARGSWLLVFNRTVRRDAILHPPQDPEYRNLLMRSEDEGRSWSPAAVVPSYHWSGVECAGLTALRSGRVLLNQWRFDWYPLPVAQAMGPAAGLVGPERLMGGVAVSQELDAWAPSPDDRAERYPWARGGGETWLHLSDDDGRTFARSRRIDTVPFSGGYGMRGAVELPDGTILLPLSDVPNYRAVFVTRSVDGGESWSAPRVIAAGPGHEFEEPAPLLLASGRILMLLRDNGTRILHAVHSDDGGQSWIPPEPTGISAYPAHLLRLADGRLACVAGRRQPPYGIWIYLSEDDGTSWAIDHPLILRDDLPNKDLGYPTAAVRTDGSLFVAYYAQDEDSVTGIYAAALRP